MAIIPTGSELVPIGEPLIAGSILEYNSLVMAAQIKAMGGEATRYPITADNLDLISVGSCKRPQASMIWCFSMQAHPQVLRTFRRE